MESSQFSHRTPWRFLWTDDPRERRNILWFGLNGLLKQADLPLYAGQDLLQAFQVRVGLSNTQIGLLGLVNRIAMAGVTFLASGLSDRIRNRVAANAWLTSGLAVFPLGALLICIGPEVLRAPAVVFGLLAALTVFESAALGLMGMVMAALFVRAVSESVRGRVFAAIGFVGGVVGIGVAAVAALALRHLGYPAGFAAAFGTGTLLLLVAAVCASRVRELPQLQSAEPAGSAQPLGALLRVARMREFRLLAPPNILRGLGDGAVLLALSVGMRRLQLPVEYGGWAMAANYASLLVGTGILGLTVDRFGPGRVLLAAAAAMAIGLLGVVLAPSHLAFLAFYWLLGCGYQVEGYAVPLAHYAIVPAEAIGAFTGMRLMIFWGVNAIASGLVGYLLDHVPEVPIYACCAVLKLVAGGLYWHAFRVRPGMPR